MIVLATTLFGLSFLQYASPTSPFSLACWLFTLIYRRAVRVGLIARYSAENIS
jgi:hypothetical protein